MAKKKAALQVVRYFEIYRMYLLDNNLADDSKTISVKSLVNFVQEQIDEVDFLRYYQQTTF